jgi:hypothetical protein
MEVIAAPRHLEVDMVLTVGTVAAQPAVGCLVIVLFPMESVMVIRI